MPFGPWPGEKGAGTLAEVYAAGAASPVTDDIMGMVNATARFQAADNSDALPYIGLFEMDAASGVAPSGLPAQSASLRITTGVHVGGRILQGFNQFDPDWDGSWNNLDNFSWIKEVCTAAQLASNHWFRTDLEIGSSRYTAAATANPPNSPPDIGPGKGAVYHQRELYNNVDGAVRTIEQVGGFGQVLRELSPVVNGTVYQWSTHYRTNDITPAANDGVGWGVWDGDLTHGGNIPQASLEARSVTNNPANDWYWALALRDTAGAGTLGDVATFKRTGINFGPPVQIADGVATSYITGLLDLTTAADNLPISVPKRPGYIFVPTQNAGEILIHDMVGVASGNLQFSVGNDALHSNTMGTTTIAASFLNAISTFLPYPLVATTGPGAALIDSNTQIVAKIVTGIGGVTSAHGYIRVSGFWVPV